MNPSPESSKNPYAPPASENIRLVPPTIPAPATSPFEFRYPNRTLCTITCVLLCVWIAAQCVSIGSSFLQLQLLQSETFSEADATANDLREGAVGIASLVTYLITAILFSTWINRAHHNVRGFGANAMSITPGWAVGYFFVPIFNLFKPYVAMSELWRASRSPDDWKNNSNGIVPWWWLLWIVSAVGGRITTQVSKVANDVKSLIDATWLDIVMSLLAVVLAIVALRMIRRIQSMQEDWVSKKGAVALELPS